MKEAVLTGNFFNFDEIKKILLKENFKINNKINEKTSLLIVGSASRSYFASSPVGLLIHQATKLEITGQDIKVIYESEFEKRDSNDQERQTSRI